MQDVHSVGGGRLYSGGGDRRLRPHNHQNHQALKCPRCDSLNTKFCYYNNYNLSQPRHFCKSCRRYWTKGGVLRNVPVGGGCRKTKRSSKTKPSSDSSSAQQTEIQIQAAASATASERERKSNSHNSSSENSSLTMTTNSTNVEAVSVHSSSSVSNVLSTNNDCKLFDRNNNNNGGGFEGAITTTTTTTTLLEQGSDCGGIFSDIGSFTNLLTTSSELLPFGFSNLMNSQQGLESHHHHHHHQWQQELQQEHQPKMVSSLMGEGQDHQTGLLDQTAQVELPALPDKMGNGGFGSLDWQGSGDLSLFDITTAVDQTPYWLQAPTQWTDYLP